MSEYNLTDFLTNLSDFESLRVSVGYIHMYIYETTYIY